MLSHHVYVLYMFTYKLTEPQLQKACIEKIDRVNPRCVESTLADKQFSNQELHPSNCARTKEGYTRSSLRHEHIVAKVSNNVCVYSSFCFVINQCLYFVQVYLQPNGTSTVEAHIKKFDRANQGAESTIPRRAVHQPGIFKPQGRRNVVSCFVQVVYFARCCFYKQHDIIMEIIISKILVIHVLILFIFKELLILVSQKNKWYS